MTRRAALGYVPALRDHAPSRQAWSNWKRDGVPWDVFGRILLGRVEHLSHQLEESDVVRSVRVEGGAVPEPVKTAQGRVWEIFMEYGEKSKQWKSLTDFLETWAPVAPVLREAVTSPRPRSRARRRTAQE